MAKDSILAYVVFGQQWTVWDNYLPELNLTQGFPIYYHPTVTAKNFAYGANINGDRYEDMLISVSYNASGTIVQELFVIYGNRHITALNLSTLTTVQGIRISYDSTTNDKFGESLDGAGDVNGDGYDDIIVSARNWNNKQGNVYLIFGNSQLVNMVITPNTTFSQGVVFSGEAELDIFGSAIGAAGDINSDGLADFLIGAYNWSESYGRAYAVYGGASLPGYVHISDMQSLGLGFSMSGEVPGDSAGWAARGIGDINDDGISDIAVSAPYANLGTGYIGVLYGRSDSGFEDDYELTSIRSPDGFLVFGAFTLAYLGFDISLVNDMNGDSVDDFAISAPYAYVTRGAVYIIYGETGHRSNYYLSNLSPEHGSEIIGDSAGVVGGLLGYTICGIGDYNRDGVFDIIMAQPPLNSSVVYLGNPSGLSDLDLSSWASLVNAFTGGQLYDRSGFEVSFAGDVNNDSFADFLIGAYQASPNGRYRAGSAYLIYGSADPINLNLKTLVPSRGTTVYGAIKEENCGKTVMSGDFNGDKNADIIVGCVNSGSIYVLFGNGTKFPAVVDLAAWNSSLGVKIVGTGLDQTGYIVLSADYNHDGIMDLYITAPYADPLGRSNAGVVYILWGGMSYSFLDLANFNSTYGIKIIGAKAGNNIGCCKYFAVGDFNGDTYEDIGISSTEQSDHLGMVYVIFGNDSLSSYIDLAIFDSSSLGIKVVGAQKNSSFGYALAGVGDFNRDGFSDLLIGAYAYDSTTTADVGASYLIYGSASPVDVYTALLTRSQGFALYGEDFNDRAGSAVSPAGDVNNDLYSDFIIGSNGHDGNRGAAFVVFGQAALVTDAITLEPTMLKRSQGYTVMGAAQGDRTAFYISPAGDVDNNGVSDYLIGAYSADSQKGISYLIRALPDPTSPPTSFPTSRPSDKPVAGKREPTFFDIYGGLILATAIPTLALATPLIFSQSICYYVLENWGSIIAGMDEMHKAHRGPFKRLVYTGCKRAFLQSFLESVEAKKKKQELDREMLLGKMKETSADGVEMPTLVFNREISMDSSHNPLISNPNGAYGSRYRDNEESKDHTDDSGLQSGSSALPPASSAGRLSGESKADVVVKALFRIHYDSPFINSVMNAPITIGTHSKESPPHRSPMLALPSAAPNRNVEWPDWGSDVLSLSLSILPDYIFLVKMLSSSFEVETCSNTTYYFTHEVLFYAICILAHLAVQLLLAYRLNGTTSSNPKISLVGLMLMVVLSTACYACRLLGFLVDSPHLHSFFIVVPILSHMGAKYFLRVSCADFTWKGVHECLYAFYLALSIARPTFSPGLSTCYTVLACASFCFTTALQVKNWNRLLEDVRCRYNSFSRLRFALYVIDLAAWPLFTLMYASILVSVLVFV